MSSLRENSIKKCRGVVKLSQIVPNLFKAPRKFFLDFLSPLLYNTKGGEGKSLFKQARPRVQLSFSYLACTKCDRRVPKLEVGNSLIILSQTIDKRIQI